MSIAQDEIFGPVMALMKFKWASSLKLFFSVSHLKLNA